MSRDSSKAGCIWCSSGCECYDFAMVTMKGSPMIDKSPSEEGKKSDGQMPERKPYQRPVLVSLGTLRDLTTTTSGFGNPDGGKKQRTARGGLDGLGIRADG